MYFWAKYDHLTDTLVVLAAGSLKIGILYKKGKPS